MIKFQNPDISIVRQCKLFKISRTSVYYKPKGGNSENLKIGAHEINGTGSNKPKTENHHPKSGAQDISIFTSEIMY
jgi:hypothetical protein